MTLQNKIAAKIKSERLKKGLSQETLAGLSDIDRTYMQSIERGDRNISIQILYQITTALEITIADFFKEIKL